MIHKQSGIIMAVKHISSYQSEEIPEQILNELDIFMHENICPNLIQFYGIRLTKTDCWIWMELINTTLSYCYKFVYYKLNEYIPENVIAYITLVILETLDYLKSRWQIIPKDITPSNILVSKSTIKLCDFGITKNITDFYTGERPDNDSATYMYLSPERIDPSIETCDIYDVQHTVWSLGITRYELCNGYFPFKKCGTVLGLLTSIVTGPPIILTNNLLSNHCKIFVNSCLNRDRHQRPKYQQLLEHPFLHQTTDLQQAEHTINYLSNIIDGLEQNTNIFEPFYYFPSTF